MRRRAYVAELYSEEREQFLRSSTTWSLIRWYGFLFVPPILVILVGFGLYAHADLTTPVQPVPGVVTESSRPLNGEDKAPVDWTGDGKPDGWLIGEWLPGDHGTVYLVAGEQVAEPMTLAGYLALGIIVLFFCIASAFGIGILLLEELVYKARDAAERDWRAASRVDPDSFNEWGPTWAR